MSIPPAPKSEAASPRGASPRTLAGAAVAFTILAWASSFPLIRIGLQELDPLPLAAARFGIAAVMVLLWLAWKRPVPPTRSDALRFVACGLMGVALYNALLNGGQRTVSAGAASFIVNSVPIITALLATLFLRERLTLWGWLGSAVSFLGIGLIASGQPGGLNFGAEASLVVGAAVCQAVYFILQRPLVPKYGALPSTAYTILAGALLLSPWMAPVASRFFSAGLEPSTIGSVVVLGVVPAALGYATWSVALGHFGAARASNFLYLVPPVAIGLASVLNSEYPAPATLVGGFITIAGVALVNLRGRG